MKKSLLATAAAIAFLGVSNAAADEVQLIPECYADGQSRSEFRACVQRNAGPGGDEAAFSSREGSSEVSSAASPSVGENNGEPPAPAGLREREDRRFAASDRGYDLYGRGSEQVPDAFGPPDDAEVNGGRPDADRPEWGASGDADGYGPPEFGPPAGEWDGPPMPPPDGPYY